MILQWWRRRRERRREQYDERYRNLSSLYPWAPPWLIHQCLSEVLRVRAAGWEALAARANERRFLEKVKEAVREAHP